MFEFSTSGPSQFACVEMADCVLEYRVHFQPQSRLSPTQPTHNHLAQKRPSEPPLHAASLCEDSPPNAISPLKL